MEENPASLFLSALAILGVLWGCGGSNRAIVDASATDGHTTRDGAKNLPEDTNQEGLPGLGEAGRSDEPAGGWEVGSNPGQGDATGDLDGILSIGEVTSESGTETRTSGGCVVNWPKGPAAVPSASASLSGTVPSILWRKWSLAGTAGGDNGQEGGGIAESGSYLVVAAHNGINLVDKGGTSKVASGFPAEPWNYPSPVTTDVDGTIFFSAPTGTYALNPDGTLKWRQPEGGIPYGEGTSGPAQGTALSLDPDGILYGVSADLKVRAFRATDGAVLWRVALGQLHYPNFANQSALLGGAGNALFVRPGSEAIRVLDKRDGTEISRLLLADGMDTDAAWTTNFALGFDETIFGGVYFFDICARPLLPTGISISITSTRVDSYLAGTVGRNGTYAVYIFTQDQKGNTIAKTDRLSLYDRRGNPVGGPVSGEGQPMAIGADDTLYIVSCYNTNPPENRLYAYDSGLREIWHLDLGRSGSYCPSGYGALDDDGVLYLTISHEQSGGGEDIMAIQTQSPGLARSAWPMMRHDLRGTMWLTPMNLSGSTDADFSSMAGDGQTTAVRSGVDAGLDVSMSR